jgi:hypothetical protein
VVVAHKVGVICKSFGERIEVEDEYIRGVRATEMVVFYSRVSSLKFILWKKLSTYVMLTVVIGQSPRSGLTNWLYRLLCRT